MDASKIEREIGWRAQVPFDAGLRDTVAWYLDNQDWCCAVTEGSDAGERLGLRRRADR
jgi:dTDP-glucose 4,6-dehydratase